MIRRKALAALMLGGMVSACSVVGPDYKPVPLDGLPQGWTEQLPPAAGVSGAGVPGASVPGASVDAMRAWWDSFQDPTLSRLVQAAIVDNEDLKIARQRLVQARAARVIAKSADLPDVRLGIDPALQRSSESVDWPAGIGSYHTWQAELDATWEIDVFGGTRRAVEAADADIAATEEGRRAVLVSLLAEVATDYARLRAAQLRLTIARNNIDVATKALDLAQRAYQRGLGTVLDIAQAKAQLETVQAATPPLEATVARMSHAIAILLGRYPGELETELSQPAPLLSVPDSLPVSVPSEVVANRPDIRQADRRYAAATARIGVATAASLPHFAIPLTLLPQAADLGKLFSLASLTYSLGAQVTGPVYNGGRDDARITLAKAEAEAARISYERTVKEALRDVEDALVNYQTETRRQQTLAAARDDAGQALDHATRLYSAGLTDFLKVLDSERQAYQAEDREAESRLARVEHVITLYKALGGGWQGVDLDKAD